MSDFEKETFFEAIQNAKDVRHIDVLLDGLSSLPAADHAAAVQALEQEYCLPALEYLVVPATERARLKQEAEALEAEQKKDPSKFKQQQEAAKASGASGVHFLGEYTVGLKHVCAYIEKQKGADVEGAVKAFNEEAKKIKDADLTAMPAVMKLWLAFSNRIDPKTPSAAPASKKGSQPKR